MTDHLVSNVEQLRALYREPSARVQEKKTSTIDELTKAMFESSPFFLLATSDTDGNCDVTPRGGPAGQLLVLDKHTVAFPELSGNNLIDSLQNLVSNPKAGLLVMMPGRDETVRVDGSAVISTDPELLSRWDEKLRTPKCAVVITVSNLFIHCAKAFRRGRVWDAETWADYAEVPDAPELFLEHLKTDAFTPEQIRESLEASYTHDLQEEKPV